MVHTMALRSSRPQHTEEERSVAKPWDGRKNSFPLVLLQASRIWTNDVPLWLGVEEIHNTPFSY